MKRRKKEKKVCLVSEDMTHFTTITKDGSREPTKWEVLRTAYYIILYGIKGKGLTRKRLISSLIRFKAAPWKASQASWEIKRDTAPTPLASESDTE
jgi:hypothetical protein